MAYKYPIIFWNTANLIVDSGSVKTDVNTKSKATEYGKIATAISNMQNQGVNIVLPYINETGFGFKPDEENDRIIFGLRGINGIGDEAAEQIINNQPYESFNDFCEKMIDTKIIKNVQMVKLIKAGCFNSFDERSKIMEQYLHTYQFTPTEKLGMQQFNNICELNLIPEYLSEVVRLVNFKKYVLSDEGFVNEYIDPNKKTIPKCGYHDRYYVLDNNSQSFFEEYISEECVVGVQGEFYLISEKKFKKEIDNKIKPLKDWLQEPDTIKKYNQANFDKLWNKYASGTQSKWEMDSLSFYYSEHELKNIDTTKYSIESFIDLPEQPEVYSSYTRYINGEKKFLPKYRIIRLAGTVLDSDRNRHTITLLCHDKTVVTCKFNKGQFVHYSKTISETNADTGKKTTIEQPWLKRGTKIMVCGYRQDDMFRIYRYADTVYQHTVYLITSLNTDGTVTVQTERTQI